MLFFINGWVLAVYIAVMLVIIAAGAAATIVVRRGELLERAPKWTGLLYLVPPLVTFLFLITGPQMPWSADARLLFISEPIIGVSSYLLALLLVVNIIKPVVIMRELDAADAEAETQSDADTDAAATGTADTPDTTEDDTDVEASDKNDASADTGHEEGETDEAATEVATDADGAVPDDGNDTDVKEPETGTDPTTIGANAEAEHNTGAEGTASGTAPTPDVTDAPTGPASDSPTKPVSAPEPEHVGTGTTIAEPERSATEPGTATDATGADAAEHTGTQPGPKFSIPNITAPVMHPVKENATGMNSPRI